jgi:hypothetical protein
MADQKKYNFKTVKRPDGSLGYYVNGTELQDETAYNRIKQKADQTANQVMQGVESDFDSAVNKPSISGVASELDSMFKKAKGGIIKSSASSRADGCATKGKTKGRFV